MARTSKEQKAQTHRNIVLRASRLFRGHGSQAGIGQVMRELALTHGGFYRHFASKEALVGEAIAQALDEVATLLEGQVLPQPEALRLKTLVETYLSLEHVRNPDLWCAFAALGPDWARLDAEPKALLAQAVARYTERLAALVPALVRVRGLWGIFLLMSGMAGVIVFARTLVSGEEQERALEAARSHYLTLFS